MDIKKVMQYYQLSFLSVKMFRKAEQWGISVSKQGPKVCTKCITTKNRTEFYPNHKAKDGLDWACKKCKSLSSKNWRKNNIGILYGITGTQYDQMLEQRGPLCPICGNPNKQPHIDHCHKTGQVRGLICRRCNIALGMLLDNPKACLRAAIYLQSSTEPGFPATLNTLDAFVADAFKSLSPRRQRSERLRFSHRPPVV